jgi:ferrous iron transport protein B
VAVAGNPNSGKTTLFNRLTGANAKVGNYPGVTVERREGLMHLADGRQVVALDIPGTYSLSARSAEEQIAITAIAGLNPHSEPDVVIVVVDSTQLARNLYLALQVLELRLKVVVALNMTDIVRKARMHIDVPALSQALGGVPVVPISATRGWGVDALKAAVGGLLDAPRAGAPEALPALDGAALDADIAAVEPAIPRGWGRGDAARRRALATWALVSIDSDDELWEVPPDLRRRVIARHERAGEEGRDIDLTVVSARYRWIDEHMPRFVESVPSTLRRVTDAVDKVLIHPLVGFLLFVLLMSVVFESLFTWSTPLIDVVNTAIAALAEGARAVLPAGLLRDFLTEGVITGVGAVLAFLPQILLLFLFISIMEDSGYMARAAFLMDRIMKAIGLTGRAFVPMISGFACAIPAIMATRTMERRRDRMLTMMVIPIMTCSARLPVYTLIIGALYPARGEPGGTVAGAFSLQALLMVAMYMFSTVLALVAAAVLGRTVFKGRSVPLLLELPPYRMPSPRSVLRMMWERSRLFVTEAGSVILVCTITLWVLLAFPREHDGARDHAAEAAALRAQAAAAGVAADATGPADAGGAVDASGATGADAATAGASADGGPAWLAERLSVLERQQEAERLKHSFGGRLGRLLEPAIAPLGFDWKIGIGLIGAFAAREVFVSTMGVVYGMGADADETSQPLRERLHEERWPDGRRVYTPLVGLSLMVFFALAAQCMSTLAVVRRETRSWGWPVFLFSYMTALAWVASFATYQVGLSLGYA